MPWLVMDRMLGTRIPKITDSETHFTNAAMEINAEGYCIHSCPFKIKNVTYQSQKVDQQFTYLTLYHEMVI